MHPAVAIARDSSYITPSTFAFSEISSTRVQPRRSSGHPLPSPACAVTPNRPSGTIWKERAHGVARLRRCARRCLSVRSNRGRWAWRVITSGHNDAHIATRVRARIDLDWSSRHPITNNAHVRTSSLVTRDRLRDCEPADERQPSRDQRRLKSKGAVLRATADQSCAYVVNLVPSDMQAHGFWVRLKLLKFD